MKQVHTYINKGILVSIILGTLLHFAYNLSGKNKLIGYFSATNESVWEHIKLSIFPIIIYSIYMFIKLRGQINNSFFALGIGVLLSLIIVPLLFYTYTKFTKTAIFPLDITIFLLAIIIPFKVMEKIIQLPKLPFFFNILGLIIVIFTISAFIEFTYHPPKNNIFKEGVY